MLYIKKDDQERISLKDYNGEASIVILINPRNEILLHLRDDIPTIIYPDYWTVPGGQKEGDETPEEAAIREVFEETGFDIRSVSLFAQTIDTHGRNELISVYEGRIDKDISELVLNEGADMQFFPIAKIENMKIIPFVKEVLQKYIEVRSQRLSATNLPEGPQPSH